MEQEQSAEIKERGKSVNLVHPHIESRSDYGAGSPELQNVISHLEFTLLPMILIDKMYTRL